MKKNMYKIGILVICSLFIGPQIKMLQAQGIITQVIKAGVSRAIKAVDLRIQRLQNRTIWLQNVQKTLENTLSKFKLEEIANWSKKHKEQYALYYDELKQVKSIIRLYGRISKIVEKQVALVKEYGRIWRLIRQDRQFSTQELEYMGRVYSGILQQSLKNLDQLDLSIRPSSLQMSDAQRLEIIHQVSSGVDDNYRALKTFNRQNILLRLSRVRDGQERLRVERLYGFHL